MIQGKISSGKDNYVPLLKKNTVISPCCKKELHFKIWNNVVRVIEDGYYPCRCSKCYTQYLVVAPKQ